MTALRARSAARRRRRRSGARARTALRRANACAQPASTRSRSSGCRYATPPRPAGRAERRVAAVDLIHLRRPTRQIVRLGSHDHDPRRAIRCAWQRSSSARARAHSSCWRSSAARPLCTRQPHTSVSRQPNSAHAPPGAEVHCAAPASLASCAPTAAIMHARPTSNSSVRFLPSAQRGQANERPSHLHRLSSKPPRAKARRANISSFHGAIRPLRRVARTSVHVARHRSVAIAGRGDKGGVAPSLRASRTAPRRRA